MVRGNEVEVKRGQVGWSENKLAARWLWSRTKVRHFIKVLKQDIRIDIRKTTVTSLITIINYEDYQGKEQQKEHQKNIRKTSEDTLTSNDKNVKNEKNKDKSRNFIPPLVDDVVLYFKEKGYSQEVARRAFEYYSTADWKDSKGNQVRNWKQKMLAVWFKDENKEKIDGVESFLRKHQGFG